MTITKVLADHGGRPMAAGGTSGMPGEVYICMICGNALEGCTCTVPIPKVDYEPSEVQCLGCGKPSEIIMERNSYIVGDWKCAKCWAKEEKIRQEVYQELVNE